MKQPQIKIESSVPLPTRKTRIDHPWSGMELGDSFFLPNPPKADRAELRRWRHHLYYKAIKHWGSGNYTVRTVTEEHEGVVVAGVRVWRGKHQRTPGA